MIEIIAGIIVLILAIIGIAQLSRRRGEGGGEAVRRIDPSKIDVPGLYEDAAQAIKALYYLGRIKDPEKGSRIAKNVFKYIGEHGEKFDYVLEFLGHKRDEVYKDLLNLREKYKEAFDAYIAKPRIEAMSRYDRQRKVISTAISETRLMQPSWYAYWSKAISGEQALKDTKEVLEYRQKGYEIQNTASIRKEQARVAQARMG